MKVSYDHDASRLCITHLGIRMLLLHQSVIPDSAVTNKGVILKNYSEQQFLLSSSSVSPASSVSISSQGSGPSCGQRVERSDGDEELCSDHYHDIISTSESGGCDPLSQRGRVPSVFRIISQSGNNGNNNTVHRAEVRTLRVIMLPGHRGREVMKRVPSSPAPAPVTYLTSSSRPAVPGIYT